MHARAEARRPALLLDAMGTLVSLVAPAPRLVEVLQRRFEVIVSTAQARHALGAEIAFYRAHMGSGRDAGSLASLRARCAEVLFSALPMTVRADAGDQTAALLEALHFEPFDDARPALVAARAHGARVIVVSNWDISLLDVLERVGLAPLLDGVVTSAAVGVAKPEPAIFRHALALAGVDAQRARHVGDSFAQDVVGARACAIRPVLLRRDAGALVPLGPEADGEPGVETIASLAELTWP